jgi:hypothetical protein
MHGFELACVWHVIGWIGLPQIIFDLMLLASGRYRHLSACIVDASASSRTHPNFIGAATLISTLAPRGAHWVGLASASISLRRLASTCDGKA